MCECDKGWIGSVDGRNRFSKEITFKWFTIRNSLTFKFCAVNNTFDEFRKSKHSNGKAVAFKPQRMVVTR